MISSPDKRRLALGLLLAALPALAGQGDDGLAVAGAALARGDGIAAEAAARKALDGGAPRAAVAAYLGEAFALQGETHKALAWLEPGEFDRASAERGFRALGRLKSEQGEFGAAADAFNRALTHNAESSGLWVDIARMRFRSGEQHIVGDAINRALAIDSRDPAALSLQAQLVRDSRGLAAALPWFERAVELVPGDVALLGDYAATLGDLGRYKDMLGVVRRMAELDPNYPRIYYLQAVLAARAGQDNLARRLLWRAGDELAATPAGLLLSGVLEYRTGNPALAAEKFDQLLRRQPDNPTAARLLARALLAAGDLPEVAARLRPLADRADASPYVLTVLARAHEQAGRREDAAPLLDRASRSGVGGLGPYPLDPRDEQLLNSWGGDPARPEAAVAHLRRLLGDGRMTETSAFAAELNRRYPGSADIETLTGDAALLAGEPGAALAAYGAAGEVRRTGAMTQRMVLALRRVGDEAGADRLLAETLMSNPQDRKLAAQLGRRRAEQGDWTQAALLLGHASRLGGARDPRLLIDLSHAQLKAGDGAAALDSARRAYRLQPARPEAATALAAALTAQGEGGAEALLAKARRIERGAALAAR